LPCAGLFSLRSFLFPLEIRNFFLDATPAPLRWKLSNAINHLTTSLNAPQHVALPQRATPIFSLRPSGRSRRHHLFAYHILGVPFIAHLFATELEIFLDRGAHFPGLSNLFKLPISRRLPLGGAISLACGLSAPPAASHGGTSRYFCRRRPACARRPQPALSTTLAAPGFLSTPFQLGIGLHSDEHVGHGSFSSLIVVEEFDKVTSPSLLPRQPAGRIEYRPRRWWCRSASCFSVSAAPAA